MKKTTVMRILDFITCVAGMAMGISCVLATALVACVVFGLSLATVKIAFEVLAIVIVSSCLVIGVAGSIDRVLF